MPEFVYRSSMPVSAADLFEWHTRPGALERLTPPWDPVRVLQRTGPLEEGTRVVLSVPLGPARLRWVSRHSDVIPGQQFKDEQIEGPFTEWVHTHRMMPNGASGLPGSGSSLLEDRIRFHAPFGPVGRIVAGGMVQRRLWRTFRFRHDTLRGDLMMHARYTGRHRLRVAITGSHGMVGSTLVPFLTSGGHEVVRLVRHSARKPDEVQWSVDHGIQDLVQLGRIDACIHLAGENIGDHRWTESRKREIRRSRVDGTRRLAESIARLHPPPASFLCASGINYYGSRTGEISEQDGPGHDFLSQVCQEWEAAADVAASAGIRVVHLRTAPMMTPQGGVLQRMLLPFSLGLGGRLGPGDQVMSWVSPDDLVGAYHHALQTETIWGPVNVSAPHAVTNAELTATLARVLRRPAVLPAPGFALRLVLGEMADALVFTTLRVVPERLVASGYEFRFTDLEPTLRHVLGRQLPEPPSPSSSYPQSL
jgi:uncharacterized protein (TIGR01777 family)